MQAQDTYIFKVGGPESPMFKLLNSWKLRKIFYLRLSLWGEVGDREGALVGP